MNKYKKSYLSLAVAMSAFLIFSCAKTETIGQEELKQAVAAHGQFQQEKNGQGIVNFHNLAFRKKLEADIHHSKDWWDPLEIGENVRILSGIVKDSAGIEYLEVERNNLNKEVGYARATFIATDARLAVVTAREAFRYSSPSLTRLTKDTVPFMALICVYPGASDDSLVPFDYNNDYGVVFHNQYIEEAQLSYDDRDIDSAKFFFLAKTSQDNVLKKRFLQKAKEFESELFGRIISDYLDILKASLPESMAKESVKKVSGTKKVKLEKDVIFYSQPDAQGVALALAVQGEEILLTHETTARTTRDGQSSTWYLAEKKGWIFGNDLL